MSDERIILPGSVGWLPNDNPRKESNWKCWELPGQWLSWCDECIDHDKVEEHILGCEFCAGVFKKLCHKIEVKP